MIYSLGRASRAIGFTILAGLSACGGDKVTAPAADGVDVYTAESIFTPPTADVAVGGSVRFHMNRASDGFGHNAIFTHGVAGAPEDVNIIVDSTATRTFSTRGTFTYNCTVHPGMTGEVVVH